MLSRADPAVMIPAPRTWRAVSRSRNHSTPVASGMTGYRLDTAAVTAI